MLVKTNNGVHNINKNLLNLLKENNYQILNESPASDMVIRHMSDALGRSFDKEETKKIEDEVNKWNNKKLSDYMKGIGNGYRDSVFNELLDVIGDNTEKEKLSNSKKNNDEKQENKSKQSNDFKLTSPNSYKPENKPASNDNNGIFDKIEQEAIKKYGWSDSREKKYLLNKTIKSKYRNIIYDNIYRSSKSIPEEEKIKWILKKIPNWMNDVSKEIKIKGKQEKPWIKDFMSDTQKEVADNIVKNQTKRNGETQSDGVTDEETLDKQEQITSPAYKAEPEYNLDSLEKTPLKNIKSNGKVPNPDKPMYDEANDFYLKILTGAANISRTILARIKHIITATSSNYGDESGVRKAIGLLTGGYDIKLLGDSDLSLALKYYRSAMENTNKTCSKVINGILSDNTDINAKSSDPIEYKNDPQSSLNLQNKDEPLPATQENRKETKDKLLNIIKNSVYTFNVVNEKDISNMFNALRYDEILNNEFKIVSLTKLATFGMDDRVVYFTKKFNNLETIYDKEFVMCVIVFRAKARILRQAGSYAKDKINTLTSDLNKFL